MLTSAIDLKKNLTLGIGTQETYNALRASVPMLDHDRIVSEDVDKAVDVIKNGLLNTSEQEHHHAN